MARGSVETGLRQQPLSQEQISAASGAATGALGSSARTREVAPDEPRGEGVGLLAGVMGGMFDFLNREIHAVLFELRRLFNARFGSTVEVSADYTVLLSVEHVLVTADSAVEITLPNADDYDKHLVIQKVDSGGGSVTVTHATETINGAPTLASQWDTMVLFSHDGAWYTRSKIT